MIQKNDLLLLLSDLEEKGVDTREVTKQLFTSPTIPLNVLKFINDNSQLDVIRFYDKIRKSYNNKKSILYKSIITSDEKEPKEALTTLSSLLTQILLFNKTVSNQELFLKHSRAEDITKVLTKYFMDYDITSCNKLLRLIKADIVVLETVNGRRN